MPMTRTIEVLKLYEKTKKKKKKEPHSDRHQVTITAGDGHGRT